MDGTETNVNTEAQGADGQNTETNADEQALSVIEEALKKSAPEDAADTEGEDGGRDDSGTEAEPKDEGKDEGEKPETDTNPDEEEESSDKGEQKEEKPDVEDFPKDTRPAEGDDPDDELKKSVEALSQVNPDDMEEDGGLSISEWKSIIQSVQVIGRQMLAMRENQDTLMARAQEADRESNSKMLEDSFAELNESFGGVFGRGELNDISDEEYRSRNAVLKEAQAQLKGHQDDDRPLTFKEAMKRASMILFSDRVATKPQKNERRSQFTHAKNPPRHEAKGDEAALEVIDKFLQR